MTIHMTHTQSNREAAISTTVDHKVVVHIGSQQLHHAFAWASCQAITDGSGAKTVLSLCADLPVPHLSALEIADEVLVLNLAGHIDARTLHELCIARNLGKPIAWMEDWPMYCPHCRMSGPESEHFFHNALDLEDLNELLISDRAAEDTLYLEGQLVNWYGQIAPIILLSNGLPVLKVELACSQCSHLKSIVYVMPGEYGAWAVLADVDGRYVMNLCDADERLQMLVCVDCRNRQACFEVEVGNGD